MDEQHRGNILHIIYISTSNMMSTLVYDLYIDVPIHTDNNYMHAEIYK